MIYYSLVMVKNQSNKLILAHLPSDRIVFYHCIEQFDPTLYTRRF
jgi:hypothetical protein